jgi:hypothetical protein
VIGNVSLLVQVLSVVIFFVGCTIFAIEGRTDRNLADVLKLTNLGNYESIFMPIIVFGAFTLIIVSCSPLFLIWRDGLCNTDKIKAHYRSRINLFYYTVIPIIIIIIVASGGETLLNNFLTIESILYFIAAIAIDSLRRLRYVARKNLIPLNITKGNYSQDIDTAIKLLEKSRIESVNVSRNFVYRKKDVPNVFISYTHSSKVWKPERIKEFAYKILQHHGNVFVDQVNISLGSNWRSALHNRMSEASIVLCFADEISVTKGYCAAEIEAALRLRAKTNSPQIIIITDNDLEINEVPNALPIFKVLFGYENDFRQPVKIVREDSGIPDVFWASFGEPDITDSLLPKKFQEYIGFQSRKISLFLRTINCVLLRFFVVEFLILQIITTIDIPPHIYKVLPGLYNMQNFKLPVWCLFPLTFAATYTFIWLWNDIFRFDIDDEYFMVFTRLFDVLILLVFLIMKVPALHTNEIIGLFLCAFLAISMSEDSFVSLTTLTSWGEKRSDIREVKKSLRRIMKNKNSFNRRSEKYKYISREHVELDLKCRDYLSSQRKVPRLWREALISNDIKDNNGMKDYCVATTRSFAILADNSVTEKETDDLTGFFELLDADGTFWCEGELLECLGENEFLLGKAEKAFEHLSRSNVYLTFNNNIFPATVQWRILQTDLEAAIALSNCEGRSEEAAARLKKLVYKCRRQLEVTAKSSDEHLAAQWRANAEICLNHIPDEYK